jgi:hypothetical protein
LTAPCARACSAAIVSTVTIKAAKTAAADRRSRRTLSLGAIMDPSMCRQVCRQVCRQKPPSRIRARESRGAIRLPRPAYRVSLPCQGTIKVKPLWPCQGRENVVAAAARHAATGARSCDHECIAAVADLWFGGAGIPLSRRGLPGTSRRGAKPADAGGVIPWRLAPKSGFAFVADDRGQDQHQGSRDKA